MRHAPALLLSAALLPLAAPAQELARTPEGWTGTGELGLAMARGNSRSESLNTRLRFSREEEHWKNGFSLSALRSRAEVESDTDGDGIEERRYETSANRYDVSGSSAYRFSPRHHVSANGRYEHDDFSSYDYQGTVAIGFGSRFIDNDRTKFTGEIGPGYRRARTSLDGEVQSSLIGRGLLDLRHQLTDNTELFNTLLVESGKDNTFAQNDLGVSVAMNERFALKAGLQARHNTEVEDASTRRTDTLTTVNLVYNFR
ncbi:protein of unknown function DUF481 [Pseudoxanthomonas suwonensis 11-1]|uniref:DUF481 domain-containing protein n=1 Tax=Pseudoxanthomonas suwonensis (strain 11-1) TaxID=743721 RepID=E6WQH0_PSEUU|nr:DUF481 domain-containing protein [Pseudoxanthomonas suwonensis]ADV26419.1 protein of unknown function DUF481 [Pseudoxanthomonas suwonensis 11-1]